MVLLVQKSDIHPDKLEAYMKWTEGKIQRPWQCLVLSSSVRTGRPLRPDQVVTTYEFADMVAWATWYMNEDSQRVLAELHTLALRTLLMNFGGRRRSFLQLSRAWGPAQFA